MFTDISPVYFTKHVDYLPPPPGSKIIQRGPRMCNYFLLMEQMYGTYSVEYQSDDEDANEPHHNSSICSCIPMFIKNGYRVDRFIIDSIKGLEQYKNHIEDLNFMNNLGSVLSMGSALAESVKQLYRLVASIMLNLKTVTAEEISVIKDNNKILDIGKLVGKAEEFFKSFTDTNNLLEEVQFPEYLNYLNDKLNKFVVALYQMSCSILTSSILHSQHVRSDEIDELMNSLLCQQQTSIDGHKYMEFLLVKSWIYDNVYYAFNDMIDIAKIEDNYEFDRKLLMSGVFYEYFLYHNPEILPNKRFHERKECEIILNNFELYDIFSKLIEIKYEKDTGSDIKYFININGKRKEFFPNFEFRCINQNEQISFEIKAKGDGEAAIFHSESKNEACQGFTISFRNSGKKYFVNELYSTSENFNPNFYDLNQESFTLYTKYKAHPGLSIVRRAFHVSEYVELTGFFLLNKFGLLPNVDAFFSNLYMKPMVVVEGIDITKFTMISSKEGGRFNFNLINNDINAIFISAIQIFKMRLLQLIFMVDSFCEANIAISICRKEFNGFPIEYIDDIMLADIIPTGFNGKISDLTLQFDDSEDFSQFSFEDFLFYRLDHIRSDDIIFLDEDGAVTDDHEDYEIINNRNKEMHGSLANEKILKDIYGKRIIGLSDSKHLHRYTIIFYAMHDLFYNVYINNMEMFKSITEFKDGMCKRIAFILLKNVYNKITQDIEALPEIPNINLNEIDMNYLERTFFTAFKSDYVRYWSHSIKTIRDVIDMLANKARDDGDNWSLLIPHVFELIITDSNEYKVIKVQNFKDTKLLQTHSRYVGFAFLDSDINNLSKILDLFDFKEDPIAQKEILATNFRSKASRFYFTCSPMSFDFLYSFIKDLRKTGFKNVYLSY